MKTVIEIYETRSEKKGLQYLDLCKKLSIEADRIASENTDQLFIKKMAEEINIYFRKCESADCEYTAYVNANAAEIWFKKIQERI